MFYIHHIHCISPQQTSSDIQLKKLNESVDQKLFAIQSSNEGIPLNLLRRMGKAVKMGIGAGFPLIQQARVDGIIIGTANGGLEDCIKFLNQIIDFEEGRLTPTNFVQSTTNAIAAQLGIMNANQGYNITHAHRGLSFENAVLDAAMLLRENPEHTYLLGGVDEISDYNYNIENLAGWYKKERISSKFLYDSTSPGSIPGEGAAMFIVNQKKTGATAKLNALKIFHTENIQTVKEQLSLFLKEHLHQNETIDLFITGENGDQRILPFYLACETLLKNTPVARYKHMFGEFPSASALSLWLACYGIDTNVFPDHMYKGTPAGTINTLLIYNAHKGNQHSFMMISKL